jgi:hypothetical protein
VDRSFFDGLSNSFKEEILGAGFTLRIEKQFFDLYFIERQTLQHNSAVRFLVNFAAVIRGMEGKDWDWEEVRHLSQGLYGSMEDDRASFMRYNIPNIEIVDKKLSEFQLLVTRKT